MIDSLLIENVCRKVLKEYLSVSDDVLEMSDECFSLINYTFQNADWDYQVVFDGSNALIHKSMVCNVKANPELKLGKLIDTIEIRLFGYNEEEYNFDEYEELLADYGLNIRQFIPDERKIDLYFPIPAEGLYSGKDVTSVKSMINHEINHALQSSHRNGGTYVTNAYQLSTMMNDFTGADSDGIREIMHYIRVTYYIFHPDEVDSKMQELYYQLANNGYTDDYRHMMAYIEIKEAMDYYEFLKEAMLLGNIRNVPEIIWIRPQFPAILKNVLGVSVSNWNNHCINGIKRFYKQLRRLVQRFNDENKEI